MLKAASLPKIGVAILGVGRMGETHLGAAQASPFVGKICGYEPDPQHAARRAQELAIPVFSRLEDILEDPEIRLVSIAAVNSVHAELALRALRAGKAVLCEKPMAENLADAEKMVVVQQETGGFLQIGFELRYSQIYQRAKEWIERGLIGEVVNSHCRYYCSEFHLKDSWRSKSSGTLIGEKLSHYLDLQRWYAGSPVAGVFSMSAPNVVPYFNHPDNHQISLQFANGTVAQLNFSMFLGETDASDPLLDVLEKQSDDGHCLQFHIFGTKGAIETDVFRRRLRRWEFTDGPRQLMSKIVETLTYPKAQDEEWIHNVHGQNLRVIERVAQGLPPETPATDSLETMKVCFAAERSAKENRPISFV